MLLYPVRRYTRFIGNVLDVALINLVDLLEFNLDPIGDFSIKRSRFELTSSISMVAITTRIWPNMISLACSRMACMLRPSKRSCRIFHDPGLREIPTVKVEGVFTRMFCLEGLRSGICQWEWE